MVILALSAAMPAHSQTAKKRVQERIEELIKKAMAEQEKYAAIEQQAAGQDAAHATAEAQQDTAAVPARPQPESAQLSLDIPLPEATPATLATPADKT